MPLPSYISLWEKCMRLGESSKYLIISFFFFMNDMP
jgi:hypothetical protein